MAKREMIKQTAEGKFDVDADQFLNLLSPQELQAQANISTPENGAGGAALALGVAGAAAVTPKAVQVSRRKLLGGAGAVAAAGLATTQPANAQIGTFTPEDWADGGMNGTRNIASFNQQIRFDYYPDVLWTTQYPEDPNVTPSPQAPAFTLNQVRNSLVSQQQNFENSALFKDEQKRVINIENNTSGLSKTVVQPFIPRFGEKAPKEVEYRIKNPLGMAAFNPSVPGIPARPGSLGNGILVLPTEALKKKNIGMSISRTKGTDGKDKDMVITLSAFGPDGRTIQQVTRYVIENQLKDGVHPPITKIYFADRNVLLEPEQYNSAYDSRPNGT
jgi:hypothetical protein